MGGVKGILNKKICNSYLNHKFLNIRTDNLITCEAWKEMKRISAREGLISIAYEKKYAEFSRLYQIAKLYLFSPSSGLYSCMALKIKSIT